MQDNLNPQQAALLALMETKSFDALSQVEQDFVLSQVTQETYDFQHQVLKESAQLEPEVAPLPLFNKQKAGIVIPLYLALVGAAAAVLLTIFILQPDASSTLDGPEQIIAQTDTVYVNQVRSDTVVNIKTKYITQTCSKNHYDVADQTADASTNLIAIPPPVLPKLTSEDLANKGNAGINQSAIKHLSEVMRTAN